LAALPLQLAMDKAQEDASAAARVQLLAAEENVSIFPDDFFPGLLMERRMK